MRSKLLAVAGTVTFAVVLYPLSVGPAFWICLKLQHEAIRKMKPDVIEDGFMSVAKFYEPLEWLSRHSQPFSAAYNWYLGLWKLPPEQF